MSGKNILIVGGLILVLCVGAWGWHSAQKKADRRLQNILLEHDLQNEVQYADVSYNPITNDFTVTDVVLGQGDGAQHIDRAVLYEIDQQDNGFPLKMVLHLEGINIDLAKQGTYKEGGEDVALVAMGYQQMEVYVNIDYVNQPDNKEVYLHITIGDRELGELEVEGELAGIEIEKLVSDDLKKELSNPFAAIGYIRKAIADVAISNINIGYRDYGLVVQYKKLMDARSQKWPDDPSIWDSLEEKEVSQYHELLDLGFPEKTARRIAGEVYEFLGSPGSINLTTDIEEPIKLVPLLSSRKQNPAVKFYLMSNASINGN